MGRPKLTDEQKKANAEKRAALKLQLQQTAKVVNAPVTTDDPERTTPVPEWNLVKPTALSTVYGNITPEELDQINKVHEIMAKADAARRAQYVTPKETVKPQGNVQAVHIALNHEAQIDEEYVKTPQFVQQDDKGWGDV